MTSPMIHHVSVINRNSQRTFNFYHKVLGLDFLLKTVNQDDIEMYHLFFGDTTGRPGTEFSVFDMKQTRDKKFGTNALERTIFAVPSIESLTFWEKRLNASGTFNCEIEDYNQSKILRFEDEDGVLLGFMPVEKQAEETYYPHATADIPAEHAIFGIHAVHCRVRYPEATARSMAELLDYEVKGTFEDNGTTVTIISTKTPARFHQELHLVEDRARDLAEEGVGSIQHIAMNATSYEHLLEIEQRLLAKNYPYSGIKNRDFFKALYYRDPNRMLIEVATEQTNFQKSDMNTENFEDIELFLPLFLEERRRFIESKL